jgi:hypothetical protein
VLLQEEASQIEAGASQERSSRKIGVSRFAAVIDAEYLAVADAVVGPLSRPAGSNNLEGRQSTPRECPKLVNAAVWGSCLDIELAAWGSLTTNACWWPDASVYSPPALQLPADAHDTE